MDARIKYLIEQMPEAEEEILMYLEEFEKEMTRNRLLEQTENLMANIDGIVSFEEVVEMRNKARDRAKEAEVIVEK